MGVTYDDYIRILKMYIDEKGITEDNLKFYNSNLDNEITSAMYKNIIKFYNGEPNSIKMAIKDNKEYYARYINTLRQ